MPKTARFIIWTCPKFTKSEIEQIVSGLVDVLQDRNPEVKPKDDFKEKHPNYRSFVVPSLAPLTEPPKKESAPAGGLQADTCRVRKDAWEAFIPCTLSHGISPRARPR
jgi:hypothetical protein